MHDPRAMQKGVSGLTFLVTLAIVILIGASLYYAVLVGAGQSPSSSSSSSSSSSMPQGVIAGYVTVGPSQPSCSANQSSCTEDLSGYDLMFTAVCPSFSTTSGSCKTFSASIAPSGHYSILLDPGTYSITGLTPSCMWTGCSSAFPQQVTVQPGQQIVVNIDVDTGIR